MKHGESSKTAVVHTIDLNFLGMHGAIASYLIPHAHGAILVESGPGSTIPGLEAGLAEHGFTVADVTDVLLTHIHLDHAGAAGWIANQGARIHVHPLGAPHLLNPEKLLNSASRIYGDQMDRLWGEFLPVPEERLSVLQDGETLEIEGLRFEALDTPGHANHHFVYIFEDTCFSGDVGGIRLRIPVDLNIHHLRLPMPPPEFNLEAWRTSLKKLQKAGFSRIAPTHFGIFDDVDWHLAALDRSLNEIDAWMGEVMPKGLPVDALNRQFLDWTRTRSISEGVSPEVIEIYEAANPSWMSTYGMQRYWDKQRQGR